MPSKAGLPFGFLIGFDSVMTRLPGACCDKSRPGVSALGRDSPIWPYGVKVAQD